MSLDEKLLEICPPLVNETYQNLRFLKYDDILSSSNDESSYQGVTKTGKTPLTDDIQHHENESLNVIFFLFVFFSISFQ